MFLINWKKDLDLFHFYLNELLLCKVKYFGWIKKKILNFSIDQKI